MSLRPSFLRPSFKNMRNSRKLLARTVERPGKNGPCAVLLNYKKVFVNANKSLKSEEYLNILR